MIVGVSIRALLKAIFEYAFKLGMRLAIETMA